jgi:tetratricopeptide (TPR) repeat protein
VTANWRRVILAAGMLAAAWLGAPEIAAASRFYRAEEIAQAHALRARVMDRVPGLAEALDPAAKAPLAPDAAAGLRQQLQALERAEADNPFYHWAVGEVRHRAGDAGAVAEFTRAAAAARNQPLIHWLLWEAYLDRGQFSEADAELGVLQEIYLSWGLMQFPQLADRLVRRARVALARGSFQEAAILLERSIDSDPSQPTPNFLMARLLWRLEKGNLPRALRFLADGTVLAWQSRETRQLLLGNVLADVIPAFHLGLGVLATIVVFRCRRLVAHDARHLFRLRLTPAARAAMLAALLVPVAVGLGIFWGALLILVLCAPYLRGRDRLGVSAMVLVLCLLPAAYRQLARNCLVGGSPKAVLAEEAEAGARGEESVAQIRRWILENPDTYVPPYFLGLVHKRRGEMAAAARELVRATALAPGRPAPWVALGNVRHLQGDKDGALAAYEKAGAPPPNSALAHRNIAFIALERLEFERARQEFEEAFRLDPHLVSVVSSPRLARAGGFLADERLGEAELREALAPGGAQEEALAAAIGAGTIGRFPLRGLPVAAAGILLAFWGMARWGARLAQARACQQCGKVFCPRCQATMPAGPLCASCAAVVHLREGIGASLKIQRRWEVEQFQERRRRTVSILALFPGAGHLYLGRTLGGLLLLLPALFLLSQIVVGHLFWRPLPLPPEMSWLLSVATEVPLLLILCGISVLRAARLLRAEEA